MCSQFRTATLMVLLISIIALTGISAARAEILFQDNFDNSPDWQSNQTVNKSAGGKDISWPTTNYKRCSPGYCPPPGWTSYRCASSTWTDDRGRDTYVISTAGARGGSGKGLTYNVESTGSYGAWAGGSLDLWLGTQGYQELYIRMYLKYSSEWAWSDTTQHGQEKLIRISTFNADIFNTNYNPQTFGSSSVNWPVWYPDWYYNAAYKYAYFMSSVRKSPDYDSTGDDNTYTDSRFHSDSLNLAIGDNQWHCYEFHVKMNSSPGIPDGVWEFFLDGNLKKSRNNIVWKKAGSNSIGWNWLMFLDNVTVAPYPSSSHKEMSIYMDDVVVSTTYVGPDDKAPSTVHNLRLPPSQPQQ